MVDNTSRNNLLNNYGLPRSYFPSIHGGKNFCREKNYLATINCHNEISCFLFLSFLLLRSDMLHIIIITSFVKFNILLDESI